MSGFQSLNLRNLKAILGRRKVVLVLALVITTLIATGFVWAQKKVSLVADGKNSIVTTFHTSPEEILTQAGIQLGPKDEYRTSTAKVETGTTIEVYRAVPVTVTRHDKTEVIVTGKPTVGDLAASLGFTAENSKTVPEGKTRIVPDMQVAIIAVNEKLVAQTLPIPVPVVREPDGNLEKDTEEVVQEGSEGVKEATVKLRFEDGQQVAADIVAEKIISPATPQIVREGTRDTVQTSRGMVRFKGILWMEATAYTPTDGSWHGITASGIAARRGIVAVDPNVIPLGTRLYIPGYGMALAADTGGDIVGDRIDLCVESHGEAWAFGRRMVKIYVVAD
ncbi:MAG: G5 domain-containing protein [Negativicutes bacterium]|nr:G5 domain-containing protein [Negativicutes bacterium]